MLIQPVVVAHHSLPLVVVSLLISILGAYAWQELSQIVRSARGRAWLGWLVAAAAADAIGTWSMHYTGKLALRLPVPVLFDWRLVLLSWIVGVIGSGAALLILGRYRPGRGRAIAAGICLGGVGISGLHFIAMAAMRLPGLNEQRYSVPIITLSILVAIVASTFAVVLASREADAPPGHSSGHRWSVLVRGMANPGMHYIAMAGVVFVSSAPTDLSHAVDVLSLGVLGISIVPVMGVGAALLGSLLGRLETNRALLNELFDQAPQAVALMIGGDRIVRVNREFTVLFGYAADESLGQCLRDLIGGVESREESGRQRSNLDHERRVEVEAVFRRKDGSRLPVSMVRVPVSLPDRRFVIYAIFVDISERKKAEEALRLYPRRLLEMQEKERQRMARELHDEIGQVLTGLGLMLEMVPRLPPEHAGARVVEAQTVLDDLIGQVRNLALDLRPAVLDDLGLSAALAWLFDRYSGQTGVRIQFEQHGLDERRLDPEVEITAYRIVQEALTNVARHAGVREARVHLRAEQHTLRVQIEDRGAGFNPRSGQAAGIGLTGMRERASIAGGGLVVESSLGEGTCIIADLPLSNDTAPGHEPV